MNRNKLFKKKKLQKEEKLIKFILWLKKENIRSKNKMSIKILYDFISYLIIYKLFKIKESKQHIILWLIITIKIYLNGYL